MSENVYQADNNSSVRLNIAYWLGLAFVAAGLLNVTPNIPGWEEMWRSLTGLENLTVRRFSTDWLFPIAFFVMMLIVALKHSMWCQWIGKSKLQRGLGLVLDVALVVAGLAISLAYLIELDSVCLIDQLTGDRARLVADALKAEVEFAQLFGLPIPDQAEDPRCLNTTGSWLPVIIFLCISIFLMYNVKVWGFWLVLVAILVAIYTFGTVLNWYYFGAEDQNKYLVTILSNTEPRSLNDGREHIRDALLNGSAGILGRFINVLLILVFPYMILGSLFGRCAGGQAMIKLAFRLTRKLRGGPAHAAVMSSAMFGAVSGGPVVNVLSTGVLTIPMMLKRGFTKVFAGGVESAASSGGSIMPPIMGVAAFVMAALTGVPYKDIVIGAAIPALIYFACLFLSVVFQSRKQNIGAVGEFTDDMRLTRHEKFHLVQIFAPIVLILILLLTPKDGIGCGPVSQLLGSQIQTTGDVCQVIENPWIVQLFQNAAGDASAAGWWATILLLCLMFLDKDIRSKPKKILDGLSEAGLTVSKLYLMFLAVTVIDVSLNFTGLANFLAIDILSYLKSFDIGNGDVAFQLFALFMTMGLAVLLGMGMPAVPAYINVALLMGPLLVGLGIATFTAHMFIFYFAVASAITPPVALAAFAATTITNANPMATAFSAVKSGIVMFIIPFAFAIYPELLLIEQAVIDPTVTGGKTFLPGYDGEIHIEWLLLLLGRLFLSLYLLSTSLAAFDRSSLSLAEISVRLVLAALIMFKPTEIYAAASLAGLLLLVFHYIKNKTVIPLNKEIPARQSA